MRRAAGNDRVGAQHGAQPRPDDDAPSRAAPAPPGRAQPPRPAHPEVSKDGRSTGAPSRPHHPSPITHPPRVHWLTLLGAGLGVLLPAQSALAVLAGYADASHLAAIPLFLLAALYLPALWAAREARDDAQRIRIVRRTLAVSLPIVVIGVVAFGPEFAVLLLIPSTLLAIAAGLVFSRP